MKIKTDDLEKLCTEVIETSLGWTGADENAIPGLKRIRTLAGLFLKQIERDKPKGKDFHRSKELQARIDQALADTPFKDQLLNYSR